MMAPNRVALWEAINRYVVACGGDPARRTYGNLPRANAVAEVETVVRAIEEGAGKAGKAGKL